MKYNFTATFTIYPDYVDVTFHDLPGLITFGDNEDDAMDMAEDALGGYLAALVQLGKEIPEDSGIGNREVTVTI